MDNADGAVRNYQFVVPMTAEQKAKYDRKRRSEGKTSQGCMQRIVLKYIEEAESGDSDKGRL